MREEGLSGIGDPFYQALQNAIKKPVLHRSILALQGQWRDRRSGTHWKVEGKVARELAKGGSGSGGPAGQGRYHFHCDEGKNGCLRACRGAGQDPRKHGVVLHASGQRGPYSTELCWERGTMHWGRLEDADIPKHRRETEHCLPAH